MVNDISEINKSALENPLGFVLSSEEEYRKRIGEIAKLAVMRQGLKIILLAGPSASGKTTSSLILRECLSGLGMPTETVSLDDFYKTQEKMPRDEYGMLDFESVHSLETEEITDMLRCLLERNEAEVPIFNFKEKRRLSNMRKIKLEKNGAVIVEGLHALNPVITEGLPEDKILKLYVSVAANITYGGENLLSSRDIRLIRRISRDMLYRNSPPENSLSLWSSVVRGEDKYLCPYKGSADYELCSFHNYELCVFKSIMYEELSRLPASVENRKTVDAILYAMDKAVELSPNTVPEDSLMREFMLGGKYKL